MREGQEMLLGGGSTRGWLWKIGMILIKGEGSFINWKPDEQRQGGWKV